MRRLNKRITIDPTFTADDWALYAADGDRITRSDRDNVARELNFALKEAVNSGASRLAVEARVCKGCERYAHNGAYDSEAFHLIALALDDVFDSGDDWK